MSDLPDYYTQISSLEAEAYSFRGGADSAKSASPTARDIYLATDTKKLYVCVADGAWTGFDASILIQGVLTLYENMLGGGKQIKNLADPTAAQDAATRAYVLAQKALCLLLTGGTMSGAIAMGSNKITGLGTPTDAADGATKGYVDGKLDDVSVGDVTASRAIDTIYQNTSGKIRVVVVTGRVGTNENDVMYSDIGSASPPATLVASCGISDAYDVTRNTVTFIVPINYYYRIRDSLDKLVLVDWIEYDLF